MNEESDELSLDQTEESYELPCEDAAPSRRRFFAAVAAAFLPLAARPLSAQDSCCADPSTQNSCGNCEAGCEGCQDGCEVNCEVGCQVYCEDSNESSCDPNEEYCVQNCQYCVGCMTQCEGPCEGCQDYWEVCGQGS